MNKTSGLENNDPKKSKVLPEIGKQIDAVRLVHGYSRPDLSKGANIAAAQLNEIINGKLNPTLDALNRIAHTLNVPSDYLLITHHDDFLLYAIDGYLYRLRMDSFGTLLFDALSLIGVQDEVLQTIREQMDSFKTSIAERCSSLGLPNWKEKIRRFRKEAGYTQVTASEAVAVSYNHYAKFENEITCMSLPPHLRICLLYGKSSESITCDKRADMVLTKEQLDSLRLLGRERLTTLLETLRTIYENS